MSFSPSALLQSTTHISICIVDCAAQTNQYPAQSGGFISDRHPKADFEGTDISVNLSTNDYSTGIPDRDEFATAYVNLVKTVRGRYADAVIYCAVGPMLWGDGLVSARDYVSSMVNQLNAEGDANIFFEIDFPFCYGGSIFYSAVINFLKHSIKSSAVEFF